VSKYGAGPAWRTLRSRAPCHASRVHLDGEDIDALVGVKVQLTPSNVPMAGLDWRYEDPDRLGSGQRVGFLKRQRALLVRLGWTPPAEETP
jgi:hypothetical protein